MAKGYARKEVSKYGTVRYFDEEGRLHRENGPALEYQAGSNVLRVWYQNGKVHREDGHAVEYSNGTKAWYQNGDLHRKDGPAYEGADGVKEYWLSGKKATEEEFRVLHPEVFASSEVVEEESPGPGH